MIVRYRHEARGGHVHVRMFVGEEARTLALAGQFTLEAHEFVQFRRGEHRTEFADEESGMFTALREPCAVFAPHPAHDHCPGRKLNARTP